MRYLIDLCRGNLLRLTSAFNKYPFLRWFMKNRLPLRTPCLGNDGFLVWFVFHAKGDEIKAIWKTSIWYFGKGF